MDVRAALGGEGAAVLAGAWSDRFGRRATIRVLGVLFKALGSELFPTSYRSTASSVRAMTSTLAGSLGLWLESVLYPLAGSHAIAITWMLPALALPLLVVALGVPETSARELEQIAPER